VFHSEVDKGTEVRSERSGHLVFGDKEDVDPQHLGQQSALQTQRGTLAQQPLAFLDDTQNFRGKEVALARGNRGTALHAVKQVLRVQGPAQHPVLAESVVLLSAVQVESQAGECHQHQTHARQAQTPHQH